jgi:hypothetical protein
VRAHSLLKDDYAALIVARSLGARKLQTSTIAAEPEEFGGRLIAVAPTQETNCSFIKQAKQTVVIATTKAI